MPPSPQAAQREAPPGQPDDVKPSYAKADDDVKLVDLPKGTRIGFGRVLTLPKAPVVLTNQETAPGSFQQSFSVNYIEIIDGKLYHRLGLPDDTSYTNLETGENISREMVDELMRTKSVRASWTPIRPPSQPAPAEGYMELTATDTLPVHPDPSGNMLFLRHSTEGLFNQLTVSVSNDQAEGVKALTVKDLRSVLGEQSYVLVPLPLN
jgi:hypothetical protein